MVQTIKFDQIYSDYYKRISHFIGLKIGFNSGITAELTNDVFVKVNLHLTEFDAEKSSFGTWIHTIAKNIMIDYSRSTEYKNRYKTAHIDDTVNDELHQVFQIAHKENNSDMEQNEVYVRIQASMAKLKENEKTLVELIILKEYKLKEVAEITNMTLANVKVTIMRAKEKMKLQLADIYC
jgi:RNA polymerase sigma-70 factor (ECF subfamily)